MLKSSGYVRMNMNGKLVLLTGPKVTAALIVRVNESGKDSTTLLRLTLI
jgi:hypothetical protein